MKKILSTIAALIAVTFLLAGCDDGSSAQNAETKTQQDSYTHLAKEQPANTMSYSGTRDTIKFWIKTWDNPNAVSYTYLVSNGKPYAFVVLKGLPVSYCTSLTPNYTFVGTPDDGSDVKDQKVPAPSVDGVYYSGGDCSRYYGQDATTGSYVEFTAGADTTLVTRTEPLPLNQFADAIPLGDTTAQQASQQ